MSDTRKDALRQIRDLFDSQTLSVLSTQDQGRPYASLMAFAATPDLRRMIFITSASTRKYGNLVSSPDVAMLVTDSRNRPDDIYSAISVTATGAASTLSGKERRALVDLYLKKCPHMKDFARSPNAAAVCVDVETYILVARFQNVVEIRMEP
ncbi:Pyridoxamine 5'-phosphate oxidase [Candidatus Desulfarcum epimagneticum]|uniref:Pyridoxamine 5'-phosphate oxidase n=1 Tax=uncultured Desulfobacteraceae bacterium TaxID=218296 RepID=A0A484HGK5_9BACT|nr:Pyridoxamine 5'-phosphate oxidase [uncultured Desulfobacteraceae bacterium]